MRQFQMRLVGQIGVSILVLASVYSSPQPQTDSEFLSSLGLPPEGTAVAKPSCNTRDGSDLSDQEFLQALLHGCSDNTTTTSTSNVQPLRNENVPGAVTRCQRNQYTCTPYHRCQHEDIVSNGASLFNIRILRREYQAAGDQITHSDCRKLGDVCCTKPLASQPSTQDADHDQHYQHHQQQQQQCGQRNRQGIGASLRNISQNMAQFGEYPWMAAIIYNESLQSTADSSSPSPGRLVYVAGGSLIHRHLVLTSAHNLVNLLKGSPSSLSPTAAVSDSQSDMSSTAAHETSSLLVRLGEWHAKLEVEPLQHVDIAVRRAHLHPQFDPRALTDDVALLELEQPAPMRPHIGLVCLPEPSAAAPDGDDDSTYTDCQASGWGKDKFEQGRFQTVLRRVPLQLVGHTECQRRLRATKRLGRYFHLDRSFVCAVGAATSGLDTCTGDGGSPLVCTRSDAAAGGYQQVGVVSWGIGCGRHRLPGVYADVRRHIDWMRQHMAALD